MFYIYTKEDIETDMYDTNVVLCQSFLIYNAWKIISIFRINKRGKRRVCKNSIVIYVEKSACLLLSFILVSKTLRQLLRNVLKQKLCYTNKWIIFTFLLFDMYPHMFRLKYIFCFFRKLMWIMTADMSLFMPTCNIVKTLFSKLLFESMYIPRH